MNLLRRYQLILITFASATLFACANPSKDVLAPQGNLRMALYNASPKSILPASGSLPARGIGYELGGDLALQIGAQYSPIIFEKNADVLAAVKNGEVDLVFTNATPDRAKFIQFSKTVIKIEKGFLISPRSNITSQTAINRSNVKVGFSVGSNSQAELPGILPNAILIPTNSTKQAIEWLNSGKLDAFSTNKAILFEMEASLPGSKVLPEVIGYEYLALGTPMERADPKKYLDQFVDQMISSGKLKAVIERSGIRGLAPNE